MEFIQSSTEGLGSVVFDNSSRRFCVVDDGNPQIWRRLVQGQQRAWEIDLNLRGPFTVEMQDADSAYIGARRGACRAIIGSSVTLRLITAAATRDALQHRAGSLWLQHSELDRLRNELRAEVEAAERQRQLAQEAAEQERRARQLREQAEGTDLRRQTDALRSASRVRAVAMQDQIREGFRTVFSSASGNHWVRIAYSEVANAAVRRRQEGWQLQSVEVSIYEFGLSEWSQRTMPTAVIEVNIRLSNPDLGRHETICYLAGYQEDLEFNRIRSTNVHQCGEAGISRIDRWLTGVNFQSQWNARR
jgi:hypothetical protein